jgi:phosphatidate cytidylyltransferase
MRSHPPEALTLFAGIGVLLVTASVVGALLKWRVARGAPHGVIDNLNARVRAWWVIVAVVGAALWLGRGAVVGLFALVSGFALREFMTITPTRRGDHFALAVAFFLVLPVQYVLVGIDWYGLFSVFVPVYAFLLLPILAALRGDTERFLERAATLQWGLMIGVYCISHVPALVNLDVPGREGREALLLVFLLVVAQASDVLQYVWGKLLGRRKIAPSLSPGKTVEGFVGGGLSATALGAGLWWITPFTMAQAALFAGLIVLLGFFGGLVMSAIKRDRGVKDWGTLIEGHGGVLDRLDSVCFAAPVFFHVTRYFFAT